MALRLVTRRCKLRNEPLALLPCVLRNSTLRALYIVILQIPTHDCFREVGIFFGTYNVMPDIPPVGYSNAREHASVLIIVLNKGKIE